MMSLALSRVGAQAESTHHGAWCHLHGLDLVLEACVPGLGLPDCVGCPQSLVARLGLDAVHPMGVCLDLVCLTLTEGDVHVH